MKVTKVYEKDGYILVEVTGFSEPLVIKNYEAGSKFLRKFQEYWEPLTGLPLGSTVGELKSIGFKLTDYKGFQYMEKDCTIIPKRSQIDLKWRKSPSGKYYTHLQCDAIVDGLHPALSYNTCCILNEKSYNRNSNIHYGESYSGVCKAIINKLTKEITDDCRLVHVNYTMFTNEPMAEIAKDQFAEHLKKCSR